MGTHRSKSGDREPVFDFDMRVDPKALTKENVRQISDEIAKAIASEVSSGKEIGDLGEVATGFHIRVGGQHSRSFSKTADHKNVEHSRVVIVSSM